MNRQLRKGKEDFEILPHKRNGRAEGGVDKPFKLILSKDSHDLTAREDVSYEAPPERDGFDIGLELETDFSHCSETVGASPVSLYFKSISKYPLLTEEEEKNLARTIKGYEDDCTSLIMQWVKLFQKKFAALFSSRQDRMTVEQFKQDYHFFPLFEEISLLIQERKKIKHLIGKGKGRPDFHSSLAEAMNRVEAEISKSIARIKMEERRLAQFMRDVERIPYKRRNFKIRKETELEMRKTLRAIGSTAAEIKNLKNQLVKANLRLVISIAKKYLNQGVPLADLIQEGNIGLMRAIDTYDHLRGHRLVTYATWWIKQAMIRSIDCQSKTVRTPVYVNEKLNQIMKASNRLLQECKREPTLSEIAAETNTPLESVEKVLKSSKDYIPLEYLVEDKSDTVVDAAQDFSCGSIPAHVASEQLSHLVNEVVLSDLTDRERDIIKLRFGIGSEHDHTLEEIGKTFRLSRERIRQILETALRKMRTPAQLMLLREFANPN